jgi:hypothetical protein
MDGKRLLNSFNLYNMKLAQKLAIYLPFKLEFFGGGDRWTMYSSSIDGCVLLKNGLHDLVVHGANVGGEYKPILKPMDRLNEHSETYDGSFWTEIEEEFAPPTTDLKYGFSKHGMYLSFENKSLGIHRAAEFEVWQRLIENHFDVFGLIGKGFAVDYYCIS